VLKRREVLRPRETPDMAVVHFEEETSFAWAQSSLKAKGCGSPGHGAG